MAFRLGGLILMLLGAAIAVLGAALGLAVLGRPIPEFPGLAEIRPVLDRLAEVAALPPGSDMRALASVGPGQMALGGVAAGAAIALGGLWQTIVGRQSRAVLLIIFVVIAAFAMAALTAG